MTPADFRRIALSFEGAEQGSHMGAVDFRVGGRIFATLAAVKQGYGNLMLTPEMQADFVAEAPNIFVPIAGGWGRNGSARRPEPDQLSHQQSDALGPEASMGLCPTQTVKIQLKPRFGWSLMRMTK